MIAAFHHSQFEAVALLERKTTTVTVVLPSREVASTITPIVDALLGLGGLVDQVLVVDAASEDGTADAARRAGAEVVQENELLPDFGPVVGKGDAMWRALDAVRGEVVAYLDADTQDFSPHFATGLVGPLLTRPELQFVKGGFRRPYTAPGGTELPGEGGRVTELCARPLLSAFYPELAGFRQPLAGEIAARRPLFEAIPFATGYAIETQMLLDVHAEVGLGAMAEVDLEERRNTHQPLSKLGPMAYSVLLAVHERLRRDGRLLDGPPPPFRTGAGDTVDVVCVERPPLASLRAPA